MKMWMTLGWMALLPALVLAQPKEGEAGATARSPGIEILGYGLDVQGFVDLTYQSRYIWRGFDVYRDNNGATQLTAGLDFADTVFGFLVSGHRATGSGYEVQERWDYNLYYQNAVFKGEPFQTQFRLGWVYYNFPEFEAELFDLQELHAVVSMPNITTVKGLVPSYVLVKLYPAHHGGAPVAGNASGFAHILMLDYALPMTGLLPTMPEQVIKFHSEVVYNDGVSPLRTDVDHDWSNAVFGVSTDFDLGYGITLTPAAYHQISMDSSVNTDDSETWFTVSAKLVF